jgi:hypothetical protein
MALTLAILTKTLEINSVTTVARDAKKLTGFGELPSHTQNMILMAAYPDHHAVLVDPLAMAQAFFEQTMVGKARSHLHQELQSNFNVNFDPSQALVTALRAGHFLWGRISCLSNFSVSFCGSAGPLSSSADAVHLHLKSTKGGGFIDKDIDRVLRQERYLSTDVNVCAEQIQSFHAILSEIFGETPMLIFFPAPSPTGHYPP